ncbi:insulin-like growth factor-binding protein 2 [Peromyscus maniculatus bairdii]|uniref:insulin-like growth factor-binding protein 2 n=1 Tax=Peromyscus maniculatus bairdii TaxID=230844 RepID=UPI003FCF51A8
MLPRTWAAPRCQLAPAVAAAGCCCWRGRGCRPRSARRGAVPAARPCTPERPGRLRTPARRALRRAGAGARLRLLLGVRPAGGARPCGVYTPRCAQMLRCYPNPGSVAAPESAGLRRGTCAKSRVGATPQQVADTGDDHSEGSLVENHVDGTLNMLGGGSSAGRKPLKSGMKELAVLREKVTEQHRQMGKGSKHHLSLEEPKKLRPPPARTPCQQELDQVLERISTMRLPDDRGPLEHLYSLHIPNCDKHGLYNLKQCKMSLNGQRGECWCVNPNTGKLIQGAPTIRGDPECHLFYNEQQEAGGAHAQRVQ